MWEGEGRKEASFVSVSLKGLGWWKLKVTTTEKSDNSRGRRGGEGRGFRI